MWDWLSELRDWLYQIWQPIARMSGTDGDIFWGLLKILGFLGLATVVMLMLYRRKSQEMI